MRLFIVLALLAGCTGTPAPAPNIEPDVPVTPAAPDAHADHGAAEVGAFAPLPDAKVSFASPADGATVTSPVKLVFAIEGATVQAAGDLTAGTGHHHVIIDAGPVEAGEFVPKDDQHVHFGGGQTETELVLSPGEHKLTLQLADGVHRSYGATASSTIHITVSAPE